MFHHGIPYPNTKLMTQHVMREIERVLPYLSGWWWVWQTVENNTLGGSSGCGCGEGRDQKERWERLMEESGFDGYGREEWVVYHMGLKLEIDKESLGPLFIYLFVTLERWPLGFWIYHHCASPVHPWIQWIVLWQQPDWQLSYHFVSLTFDYVTPVHLLIQRLFFWQQLE